MSGHGVDRHLFGLRIAALENGFEIPDLLKHSTYDLMNNLKLSTSQVPSKHMKSISFGQLVPDGYFVCYNPQEAEVTFSISSSKSCSHTSAPRSDFN